MANKNLSLEAAYILNKQAAGNPVSEVRRRARFGPLVRLSGVPQGPACGDRIYPSVDTKALPLLMSHSTSIAVILPAAGRSTRFGGARSKLLEDLDGRAVIARSVVPFLARQDVRQVIIPTSDPATILASLDAEHRNDPRLIFCNGGDTRAGSVRAGLQQVPEAIEWVAVHDAARPLISDGLIEQTLQAARQYGAAVPALPVPLTIKQATGPLPARVQLTLPRHTLWAMQTPQIMRRIDLLDAFIRCPLPLDQITDDMQLLELIGKPVWLIQGDERNLKITHAVDLHLAQKHLDDCSA